MNRVCEVPFRNFVPNAKQLRYRNRCTATLQGLAKYLALVVKTEHTDDGWVSGGGIVN